MAALICVGCAVFLLASVIVAVLYENSPAVRKKRSDNLFAQLRDAVSKIEAAERFIRSQPHQNGTRFALSALDDARTDATIAEEKLYRGRLDEVRSWIVRIQKDVDEAYECLRSKEEAHE